LNELRGLSALLIGENRNEALGRVNCLPHDFDRG